MSSDYHDRAFKVWEWSSHNPGRNKASAYSALNLPKDEQYCAACQYVADKYGKNVAGDVDCQKCPMFGSWVTEDGLGFTDTCINDDSAYQAWTQSRDSKYAKLVLESITDWWDEGDDE